MTDRARAFRVVKRCASATDYVKIRYTGCYYICVQKAAAGERMVVSNDEEGKFVSTEDSISFPFYGASPVPFDVTLYIRKENAGDGDTLLVNVILEHGGVSTGA